MKKVTLLIICFLTLYLPSFSQWNNLGNHGMNTNIIENNIAYSFINTSGPTPATGSTFKLKSTQNDWINYEIKDTGGGTNYGCCRIENIDFISFNKGIYAENYQSILTFQRTLDAGQNWSFFSSQVVFDSKDMVMVNDSTGYISGNAYSFHHAQLFKLTPSESIELINCDTLSVTDANLEFINSRTGFIIMKDSISNNHVFRTDDSGINWNNIFTDTVNTLTSISFVDSLVGYISSYNGNLFKTINGGVNWTQMTSPTLNNINSIDFNNADLGYIACDSGEIFKTEDGMLTWENESSDLTSNLIKIQIIDSNISYCISEDGMLLKNDKNFSIEPVETNPTSTVNIFPNPGSELITISLNNNQIIKTIEVYDLEGKHIASKTHNQIDVSNYRSGMYTIRIVSDQNTYLSKFIKK